MHLNALFYQLRRLNRSRISEDAARFFFFVVNLAGFFGKVIADVFGVGFDVGAVFTHELHHRLRARVNRAGAPLETLGTEPTRVGASLRDVLNFFPS